MTRFPEGWDEARVRRLLQHYESLTEDEAVAEDEAALEDWPPVVTTLACPASDAPRSTT